MALDLPTLFGVLLLSYSASIVSSLVLYRSLGSFPGAKNWILSQVLVAAASLIFVFRARFPFPVILVANMCFLASGLSYARAAWLFRRGAGFPYRTVLFLPAAAICLWLLRDSEVFWRNLVFSGVLGSLELWTFLILVPGISPRYRSAALLAGLPFLLVAVSNFLRMLVGAISRSPESLERPGGFEALFYLFSIVTATFALLGFFLLAALRKQILLEEQREELAVVNANLREADRTKDIFMSMLAHDLRSPMAGAARYASKRLLPEDVDLAEKKESLRILVASLEKAVALLDDVLAWSRGRTGLRPGGISGEPALVQDNVDLRDEAAGILELFQPALKDKGILVLERLSLAPALCERDAVRLVLRNLLSNAIKFSPPGSSIEVETGVDADGSSFFAVSDSGAGMEKEELERLFKVEARASRPGTAGERGTGMGLILSSEAAARNGGSVHLESEPGRGTRSVFRL